MDSLQEIFTKQGGEFISSPFELEKKLREIKAFIFDWDGVFNDGRKSANGGSNFSEVDSMGTNMLRFSYYLKHQELPITAVISGEKNETAFYFCERECFHYSFFKTANKTDALSLICEKEKLQPGQIAYVFDDVLDLSIAKLCGLRFLVNHKANPLFTEYCVKNKMVDYISASDGGQYAVREITELLMGMHSNFDEVIGQRIAYSDNYSKYIQLRRNTKTQFYTIKDGKPEALSPY